VSSKVPEPAELAMSLATCRQFGCAVDVICLNLTFSGGAGYSHFENNLLSFYVNRPIVMWTLGWDIEQMKASSVEVPERNLHLSCV